MSGNGYRWRDEKLPPWNKPPMWHTPSEQVPHKSFCGLELRGVMARIVENVVVQQITREKVGVYTGPITEWSVLIRWTVPSSTDNGHPVHLSFGSLYTVVGPDKDKHGREITPQQVALIRGLRDLWEHEFQEAVWMDGAAIENPDDIHAKPPR